MKEKIYCNWLKISLGIIFLGIILDIGVAVTDISLFTVTESYMDYIFAAIVSVGLLSFSIIALVAGILQEKFYGYKLRELLTFDGLKKRINLKRYIRISLLWIVLGIVLLSLYFKVSCVNTMICLLLATIFSAGCMAYSVFDIMVNDESVQKTLKDGYESLVKKDFNKNGKISYHINTLTNALIESCKKLNIEEMEELCTLYSTLMHVVDKNVDMSWEQEKFIETRLQQVCCNISIEFGYNKMLDAHIHPTCNSPWTSGCFIICTYRIFSFPHISHCSYSISSPSNPSPKSSIPISVQPLCGKSALFHLITNILPNK